MSTVALLLGEALGSWPVKLAGGHHCPFILMVTSEMNL
jgi:hypothetical protein